MPLLTSFHISITIYSCFSDRKCVCVGLRVRVCCEYERVCVFVCVNMCADERKNVNLPFIRESTVFTLDTLKKGRS